MDRQHHYGKNRKMGAVANNVVGIVGAGIMNTLGMTALEELSLTGFLIANTIDPLINRKRRDDHRGVFYFEIKTGCASSSSH